MTFTLTQEQLAMASSVADFLDKRSPEAEVRRLMDAGGAPDSAVWLELAGRLGLVGLIVPEAYGGGGFGFRDFALVAERAGAALLVAPLLSSVSAAAALMLSAEENLKATYLPGLATGETIGTLALAEQSGQWATASVDTIADVSAAGLVQLTGTKMYVVYGQLADLFIVSARSPQGVVGLSRWMRSRLR